MIKKQKTKAVNTYLIPLLFFIVISGFFLQKCAYIIKRKPIADFTTNYFPAPIEGEQLISHSQIRISYNSKHKQANWVAYKLDSAYAGEVKRKKRFYADPYLANNPVKPDDYKQSGYDRGHLAPAGDFTWSEKAMTESFYMSNISPQLPGFNRGVWKKLEEQVRQWARENEEIYIVTAGILKENLPSIGANNKISVPVYYYKIILDMKEPEVKAIGFIIENKAHHKHLKEFAVTIDSLETVTGIDFFPALNDKLENDMESTLEVEKWFKF